MSYETELEQDEDLANLPDPTPVLRKLAPALVEVLAGVRPVEQLSSSVSVNVYNKIRDRAAQMARARSEAGKPIFRPEVEVKAMHQESHRAGVIQSVVLIKTKLRTRAVAIRLEARNQRWLATLISVL